MTSLHTAPRPSPMATPLAVLLLLLGSAGCGGRDAAEASPSAASPSARPNGAPPAATPPAPQAGAPRARTPHPTTLPPPPPVPRRPGDGVCPAGPKPEPALHVAFIPPLGTAGRYDLELTVGARTEPCVLEVTRASASARPAVTTTCSGLAIDSFAGDGALGGVRVPGRARQVRLSVARGGTKLGELTAAPDYAPDPCGRVAPVARLTLTP